MSLSTATAPARTWVKDWIIPTNALIAFPTLIAVAADFLAPAAPLLLVFAFVFAALILVGWTADQGVWPGWAQRWGTSLVGTERPLLKSRRAWLVSVLAAVLLLGGVWSRLASATGGVVASRVSQVRTWQSALGLIDARLAAIEAEQHRTNALLTAMQAASTASPAINAPAKTQRTVPVQGQQAWRTLVSLPTSVEVAITPMGQASGAESMVEVSMEVEFQCNRHSPTVLVAALVPPTGSRVPLVFHGIGAVASGHRHTVTATTVKGVDPQDLGHLELTPPGHNDLCQR